MSSILDSRAAIWRRCSAVWVYGGVLLFNRPGDRPRDVPIVESKSLLPRAVRCVPGRGGGGFILGGGTS